MVTPHDDLFQIVFQHARHAGAWLCGILQPTVRDAIDWTGLRLAPDRLRDRALRLSVADLVFSAERRRTDGPLWIVVEHKARRDVAVEAQLLRYVVHLQHRSPRAGTPIPTPVVPVLLHHGEAPFTPVTPAADDAIGALQPRLAFVVDDLRTTSEAALRERAMTPLGMLALLCLRELRGLLASEVLAAFERWADLLRAADRDPGPPDGRDAIAAIGWYALYTVEIEPRELHTTFERLLQRPEDTIMSTAEKLKREGRLEGRLEGLAEGRAVTILRMLEKRFGIVPPDLALRVRAGRPDELDRWTDRILDVASPADLFAD